MVSPPEGRMYGVVAVALLVGLAGCGGLMGGGDGCGPGDTEITNAGDADGSVTVTGEVGESAQGSFVIDDGTGTALIQSQEDVSEGDCVTVEGRPVNTSDMGGAGVAIAPSNVTVN